MKDVLEALRDSTLTEGNKLLLSKEEVEQINKAIETAISAYARDSYKKLDKHDKLVKQYRNYCHVYYIEFQKKAKLYAALRDLADFNSAKLFSIWDEIVKTGKLKFSDDIDELYYLFDCQDQIQVYNDLYKVDHITDSAIYFELLGRNQF